MALAPETSPLAGMPEIDGYRVIRPLGRGGMATVYLAQQLSLDREVAIKVLSSLSSQDEELALRFEHEARIIARLEHPSIVSVHHVGRTASGQPFYVMPWLSRGDLSQRNLQQNEQEIAEVLRALLDALGYAHARGVVHRDVKPENVLFDASGRPQLADFGIALARRQVSDRITSNGLALGSGGYMSPEQSRAQEVDGRADLYSVGVLTYELLTGELPFRATDPLSLALKHSQEAIPRLPGGHSSIARASAALARLHRQGDGEESSPAFPQRGEHAARPGRGDQPDASATGAHCADTANSQSWNPAFPTMASGFWRCPRRRAGVVVYAVVEARSALAGDHGVGD